MRETTPRAQLTVGVIGLGPTWEQHYGEAVRRLSSKLCVRAVCDAVHIRGAAAAKEFRAATISSPWQLSQRHDIKAWLILDPGWFGIYPAELAVRCGRPALFANCFRYDLQRTSELFVAATMRGESLLAEFPQRFLPATTRLRELIATKLGPVRRITLRVPMLGSNDAEVKQWLVEHQSDCVGLLDWCACVVGQPAASIEFESHSSGSSFQVSFVARPGSVTPDTPLAEIILEKPDCDDDRQTRRQIECEHGSATIAHATSITWQTQSERADELLTNERSPFEIILDQFCRRALGGLVPVPTLSDAVRGLAMLQAGTESLFTGRRISVKSTSPH